MQHDQAIATNHPSLDIYPTMLCSDDASVPVPPRDASPHSTIVVSSSSRDVSTITPAAQPRMITRSQTNSLKPKIPYTGMARYPLHTCFLTHFFKAFLFYLKDMCLFFK